MIFVKFKCAFHLILSAVYVQNWKWLEYFFKLHVTQKYFIFTADFTLNKRKNYICICG